MKLKTLGVYRAQKMLKMFAFLRATFLVVQASSHNPNLLSLKPKAFNRKCNEAWKHRNSCVKGSGKPWSPISKPKKQLPTLDLTLLNTQRVKKTHLLQRLYDS